MILGIAEDFSLDIDLDNDLKNIPSSGMFLNSGVHPSITLSNLLHFLPNVDISSNSWSSATSYGVFETTRNYRDIVNYNGSLYQSIKAGSNKQPDENSDYWVETNIESLRLKSFVYKVKDRVYNDLKLTKRLVNNQYLYEVGENTVSLDGDYAAWVFEPKGSDYTAIRINEISFQKKSTTPVNLYVVNQGVLIDTLTVTPKDGVVSFDRLDYTFSGKGRWIFAIDATDVETNNYPIDPLKYKGFVAYTATGYGDAPETAAYTYKTSGNGLGFNITAFLDSELYIDNNITEFGAYIRATFEYMVFSMFLHNSHNRINTDQRMQLDSQLLLAEVKNTNADTAVSRYLLEKKRAEKLLKRTFDTQIGFSDYEVKIGTI